MQDWDCAALAWTRPGLGPTGHGWAGLGRTTLALSSLGWGAAWLCFYLARDHMGRAKSITVIQERSLIRICSELRFGSNQACSKSNTSDVKLIENEVWLKSNTFQLKQMRATSLLTKQVWLEKA